LITYFEWFNSTSDAAAVFSEGNRAPNKFDLIMESDEIEPDAEADDIEELMMSMADGDPMDIDEESETFDASPKNATSPSKARKRTLSQTKEKKETVKVAKFNKLEKYLEIVSTTPRKSVTKTIVQPVPESPFRQAKPQTPRSGAMSRRRKPKSELEIVVIDDEPSKPYQIIDLSQSDQTANPKATVLLESHKAPSEKLPMRIDIPSVESQAVESDDSQQLISVSDQKKPIQPIPDNSSRQMNSQTSLGGASSLGEATNPITLSPELIPHQFEASTSVAPISQLQNTQGASSEISRVTPVTSDPILNNVPASVKYPKLTLKSSSTPLTVEPKTAVSVTNTANGASTTLSARETPSDHRSVPSGPRSELPTTTAGPITTPASSSAASNILLRKPGRQGTARKTTGQSVRFRWLDQKLVNEENQQSNMNQVPPSSSKTNSVSQDSSAVLDPVSSSTGINRPVSSTAEKASQPPNQDSSIKKVLQPQNQVRADTPTLGGADAKSLSLDAVQLRIQASLSKLHTPLARTSKKSTSSDSNLSEKQIQERIASIVTSAANMQSLE
jgi:hypothetical protein